MKPPSVEDFGWNGRPVVPLTAWLRALPCDVPTRVPDDLLGDRGPDEVRSLITGAYRGQRGVGSVRKWPDGSVWVLRRSVPKPRGNS